MVSHCPSQQPPLLIKASSDRGHPQCSVCEQTDQVCTYPQGSLKPGPKLGIDWQPFIRLQTSPPLTSRTGSVKRPRKRGSCTQHNKHDAVPALSQAQESPEMTETQLTNPVDHSFTGICPLVERSSPSGNRPASPISGVETKCSTRGNSRLNIHDLSFILHPSHEASTPEKEQTDVANRMIVDQELNLMTRACSALGVTQDTLNQMWWT